MNLKQLINRLLLVTAVTIIVSLSIHSQNTFQSFYSYKYGDIRSFSPVDRTDIFFSKVLKLPNDQYSLIQNNRKQLFPFFTGVTFLQLDANGILSTLITYRAIDENVDIISTDLLSTYEDGFLLGGIFKSSSLLNNYLIKVDTLGAKKWSYVYNSGGTDRLLNIQKTIDSGYIFTGEGSTNSGKSNKRLTVVKIDKAGNLVWSQLLNADVGWDIYPTQDTGFIITGQRYRGGEYLHNLYLIKVMPSGEIK
jgi:hypothetical protein